MGGIALRAREAAAGASSSPYRLSDTFDRANNASSVGTADTGQTWSAIVGTWGISSNQLYISAGGGSNVLIANAGGSADMTVTSPLVSPDGNGAGIIARCDATGQNGYVLLGTTGQVRIYKMIASALTSISAAGAAAASGDILQLIVAGTAISAKVNGTTVVSATDSAVTAGTYAGFWKFGISGPKFDTMTVL